eukprot:TRINITY_DN4344_c0_g1_i3.p1 TRINITY_DN4344_c0_g1~~TRINITY_DN4344_c0_g1_i3.p1  ORF type:complete len:282 (+),score=-55.72 TRINITY_DN4344_c0_g1_i3:1061-1906(+)
MKDAPSLDDPRRIIRSFLGVNICPVAPGSHGWPVAEIRNLMNEHIILTGERLPRTPDGGLRGRLGRFMPSRSEHRLVDRGPVGRLVLPIRAGAGTPPAYTELEYTNEGCPFIRRSQVDHSRSFLGVDMLLQVTRLPVADIRNLMNERIILTGAGLLDVGLRGWLDRFMPSRSEHRLVDRGPVGRLVPLRAEGSPPAHAELDPTWCVFHLREPQAKKPNLARPWVSPSPWPLRVRGRSTTRWVDNGICVPERLNELIPVAATLLKAPSRPPPGAEAAGSGVD